MLATRGADFNARVRDYRRELWGDGAPLVNQGYLGYRNQDITVRERRRYYITAFISLFFRIYFFNDLFENFPWLYNSFKISLDSLI